MKGARYFKCEENHGIFITKDKVVIAAKPAIPSSTPSPAKVEKKVTPTGASPIAPLSLSTKPLSQKISTTTSSAQRTSVSLPTSPNESPMLEKDADKLKQQRPVPSRAGALGDDKDKPSKPPSGRPSIGSSPLTSSSIPVPSVINKEEKKEKEEKERELEKAKIEKERQEKEKQEMELKLKQNEKEEAEAEDEEEIEEVAEEEELENESELEDLNDEDGDEDGEGFIEKQKRLNEEEQRYAS